MKRLILECQNCESSYTVEYNEETVMDENEPNICPFCGDEIEDIDLDNEDYFDSDENEEREEE